MQRILMVCRDADVNSPIFDLVRRELPVVQVCRSWKQVDSTATAMMVGIVSPPWDEILEAVGEHSRWVFLASEAPPAEVRDRLVAHGRVLAPPDPTSFRSALQQLMPRRKEATLDSGILSRIYLQGGRALADRIVGVFLNEAPELLVRARQLAAAGKTEESWNLLNDLAERAGGVGASVLRQQIADLHGRAIEEQDWQRLEKSLVTVTRVLQQQTKQDRTA